jgi:hypothetical protein
LVLLTACGSGSSGTAASDNDARDTARLKLQKCLRDNGVDLPAPGQNGAGGGGFRNIDRQKLRTAMQGPCKKFQTAAFGNITPQQRQEFQDAFVKFAACMRQNGVDVPTPNFGAGGGPGAGGGARRRLNRNDPKTKAALQKCRSSLPNGGRFGGGGPGGGGPGGPGGGPPPTQ